MKTIKDVVSDIKPIEIDDKSSSTTVYKRYNIREEKIHDPVFGTDKIMYKYDEDQYEITEWLLKRIKELEQEINAKLY